MLSTQAKRDELAHRQRQIQAMRHTATVLSSQANVENTLRETLELAVQTLCADAGSLVMHNPQDDTFTFRHVVGPIAERLMDTIIPVTGVAGRAFRSGQPVLCSNTDNDPEQQRIAQLIGYPVSCMMSVPLKDAAGRPFGTMQILNAVDAFDNGDLEVLEVMSAVAAAAIEQARLAQESRRAELVSVIGDISHDIKNMMTPIQTGILTLQLLLDDMFEAMTRLEAESPYLLREQLERINGNARGNYAWILENARQSGDVLQARTREIADVIRGESAPPQFESTDFNEIVSEVARTLHLVAQSGGVECVLQLDMSLPRLQLDRKQIYNALYNLVNNAIVATPSGGRVTLSTRCLGESEVELKVQDNGHGIPENVRRRLFSSEAISTKPGGTGLGTKIVGDVVRRHNGQISVQSIEGQGATFIVHLPLRQK